MTQADLFGLTEGDETALMAEGDQVLTRASLRHHANALRTELADGGIGRVMVRSDDPVVILTGLVACHEAGADLWVAHTNLPAATIDSLIERYQIGRVLGMPAEASSSMCAPSDAPRVHMMTSGTTGAPKVAAHTVESLLDRARASSRSPKHRRGRWLLAYQPTSFAGMQVILTALVGDGLLVSPEQRSAAGFYRAALSHQVTRISATATFWRALLMAGDPSKLSLEQITLGGEAVDQPTLDRLAAAFPDARITHIYASTEAGVVFAVHDGKEGFPAEWLDKAVQGVQLRVQDGLLHIKTPRAMRGYVSDEGQPFTDDGWVATRDAIEVRGDRAFILGRTDSTLNVGGAKVYPAAVEAFLLGLSEIREARVFGEPNPMVGTLVAAELVLDSAADPKLAKKAIAKACREGLPGYQVPRVLKIVDAIEVRASGKKG